MNNYNDKERELLRKEQEIKAKEAEIRLRELELEITQSDRDNREIPDYQTRKHEASSGSLQKLSKKLIKVGKFLGFTIVTIALMRVGFFLGMWLAYGLITSVIILIGYQIFLKDND
jgi:hypothetical protein